jgi:hypothetical protein
METKPEPRAKERTLNKRESVPTTGALFVLQVKTPAIVLQRTDTAGSFEPLSLLWKLQAHPASFLWTELGEA